MSGEPFPVHVADVELPFRCVDAGFDARGRRSRPSSARAWPTYRRWFLHKGEAARPSYAECRDAIRAHMPELLDDYDALVDAVGGGDLEARFLSHWCPPPLVAACSIAMIDGPAPDAHPQLRLPAEPVRRPGPAHALVGQRSVIGMADCGWGLMDGMNDAGLAIAISFGGRREVGHGFGIGLVVRYLLQVCATTDEAVERLVRPAGADVVQRRTPRCARRPSDRPRPPRPPGVVTTALELREPPGRDGVAAARGVLQHRAARGAPRRARHVPAHRAATTSSRRSCGRRSTAPLVDSTWGTVYTAAYAPALGAMTLLWPDDHWSLSVAR